MTEFVLQSSSSSKINTPRDRIYSFCYANAHVCIHNNVVQIVALQLALMKLCSICSRSYAWDCTRIHTHETRTHRIWKSGTRTQQFVLVLVFGTLHSYRGFCTHVTSLTPCLSCQLFYNSVGFTRTIFKPRGEWSESLAAGSYKRFND